MKYAIVFVALFAVAFAASIPSEDSVHAEILRYENDNIGLDKYVFAVETSDGKKHSEEGVLKNIGTEGAAIAVAGEYSYIAPDGVTYTVHYIADENGFQPSGDHIPKAPEALH